MPTARLLIQLEGDSGGKDTPVTPYETLSWWNTHYKAPHRWNARRVETRHVPQIRGYDTEAEFRMPCPHCQKPLHYNTEAVHRVKGNITCGFCRGQFGVHPTGSVFVAILDAKKAPKPAAEHQATSVGRLLSGRDWGSIECFVMPHRKGSGVLEVEVDHPGKYDGFEDIKKMLSELRQLGLDAGVETFNIGTMRKRRESNAKGRSGGHAGETRPRADVPGQTGGE